MRFREILAERVINLHTPEEKATVIDTIVPWILKAYAYTGGFKHIETEDGLRMELQAMTKKPGIWKLIKKDGEYVSVGIYKDTPMGRKATLSATNGEKTGARGFHHIRGEDLTQNRMYAEVSGRVETIVMKKGAVPIQAKYVSKILGKEIQIMSDGYHYTRDLGGKSTPKVMVGSIVPEQWAKLQQEFGPEDVLVIDKPE